MTDRKPGHEEWLVARLELLKGRLPSSSGAICRKATDPILRKEKFDEAANRSNVL